MSFSKDATEMVGRLLSVLPAAVLGDELAVQVRTAFVFGAINAMALDRSARPAEVQGAMLAALVRDFGRVPVAAAQECQFLVEATRREFHPVVYAIIHRGMEAYQALVQGRDKAVQDNWYETIQTVKDDSSMD